MNLLLNEKLILLYARLFLAFSFLSAVADRFGFWGSVGEEGIAWGNFQSFIEYVAYLNPFLFDSLIPSLAYVVTALEIILALFLIFGIYLKESSFISFIMLLLFALAMSFTSGIKVAFDYSVFSASALALLLFLVYYKEKNKLA